MFTNIVDVHRKLEFPNKSLYLANIAELLVLYFVGFAHLPLTIVYNRPCIDIITSFALIILCMVCCLLVVCNFQKVPTNPNQQMWSFYILILIQFFMSILSFAAMITTLETKHPFYIFTSLDDLYKKIHASEYDMTLYFKLISICTFLLSAIACATICLQVFLLKSAALKNYKRLNQVWLIKSSNTSIISNTSDQTLVMYIDEQQPYDANGFS